MGVVPKWLRDWITQMKPSQHSSGEGAVNIGKMDGGVTNLHVTQHIVYAAPVPPVPVRPRYANEAQREVLRLLVGMGAQERVVFDFMEREFGTRMVIELDELQLKRARRYAEAVRERAADSGKVGGRRNANNQHEFL